MPLQCEHLRAHAPVSNFCFTVWTEAIVLALRDALDIQPESGGNASDSTGRRGRFEGLNLSPNCRRKVKDWILLVQIDSHARGSLHLRLTCEEEPATAFIALLGINMDGIVVANVSLARALAAVYLRHVTPLA